MDLGFVGFFNTYNSNYVQVRRGRQFAVRPGAEGWSRGWWILSMAQIEAALAASAASTFCALADVVLQLQGMSIGGSLSSAGVAVYLAFEESTAFEPARLAKIGFQNCSSADVQWCRYVDDILSFSYTLCSRCLSIFFVRSILKSCRRCTPLICMLEGRARGYCLSSILMDLIFLGP